METYGEYLAREAAEEGRRQKSERIDRVVPPDERGISTEKEAIMAKSLDQAREIAAPMFSDPAVESVDVSSWIGDLRVFRDGTIKMVADCR